MSHFLEQQFSIQLTSGSNAFLLLLDITYKANPFNLTFKVSSQVSNALENRNCVSYTLNRLVCPPAVARCCTSAAARARLLLTTAKSDVISRRRVLLRRID